MSLRATGRAAEDLLTLIRALKDPTELENHLDRISTGSAQLAKDIDAVTAREAAVAQREQKADEDWQAHQAATDGLTARARALDDREQMLNSREQDLAAKVANHARDVAVFAARQTDHQEGVDRQRTQLGALQAQYEARQKAQDEIDKALDERKAMLDEIEAKQNERAKRIAEAVA